MSTSFRVTFTNKNGTSGSATFPTEALANAYAKTVKGAKVAPVAVAAPEVAVTKCPEGTAEAQKAASKDYYLTTKRGERYVPARFQSSEQEAEAMAEHFGAAACAGQYHGDAWKDWDYDRGL